MTIDQLYTFISYCICFLGVFSNVFWNRWSVFLLFNKSLMQNLHVQLGPLNATQKVCIVPVCSMISANGSNSSSATGSVTCEAHYQSYRLQPKSKARDQKNLIWRPHKISVIASNFLHLDADKGLKKHFICIMLSVLCHVCHVFPLARPYLVCCLVWSSVNYVPAGFDYVCDYLVYLSSCRFS